MIFLHSDLWHERFIFVMLLLITLLINVKYSMGQKVNDVIDETEKCIIFYVPISEQS